VSNFRETGQKTHLQNVLAAAKLIHDLHPALLSSAQSAFAIQVSPALTDSAPY
jgi:hypothetical protein